MGDPGPVVELQGEEGVGSELGSTEDVSRDHAAGGLLTIWLEDPAPPIIQSRPTSAWWQLVGRRLDCWAPGDRRAEAFFVFHPFLISCSILPLTLPSHTRHLPATLPGLCLGSSSQPSSSKVSSHSQHTAPTQALVKSSKGRVRTPRLRK